jgi:two-component system response regulator AtoC
MNLPVSTLEQTADLGIVLGHDKSVQSLNATAVEIARTDIPVLILGESGTGKEVYARLLHRLSGYADSQLKKMNCSILDPAQLQRQLQGDSRRLSQLHPLGSLFLDGIDELDPACQRVLLSMLPDSYVAREKANSFGRLISSSSRNLEDDVGTGQFRKELYFRINGVCLRLPPLRERKEDIGMLLEHFLREHAQELSKTPPVLDQGTVETLMAYDWPGNIRELENLARKMVALGDTHLAVSDFRIRKTDWSPAPNLGGASSLKIAARAASRQRERELILEALERTKWNRKRAARELQISYKALLYKLKQIESPETEK